MSNRSNISTGQGKLARMVAEILGTKNVLFEATWPWLLSAKKHNMYVDIYVPDFTLAIEYQGQQHYFYPNLFHKTVEEFTAGQARDTLKRELLIKRKIRYISWRFNEPLSYGHVIERLERVGIVVNEETKKRVLTLPDPSKRRKRKKRTRTRKSKRK